MRSFMHQRRSCLTCVFVDLVIVLMPVAFGLFCALSWSRYNTATVTGQDLESVFQKKCVVRIPPSSVHKFDSLSLDSTKVLFVHFSGYNVSLQPSHTTDILDPVDLVWVESTAAPFLSLDLGFNVYSFTTLSKIVHHMNVTVEVEPINCLRIMNHSCVTWNLARAFLGNVTRERGVLCYAINDSNSVNYRCCKVNKHTKQVECGISPVLSPEMKTIFIVTAIATVIAFMCFPALFNIVPDEEKSNTLSANSQVHNPLSRLAICTVHALRRYSTKYYLVNVFRKLLIGLALPMLYYIDHVLQWYTATYDIPKIFNDAVKNHWVEIQSSFAAFFRVLSTYIAVLVGGSILPTTERLRFSEVELEKNQPLLEQIKNTEVNWLEPWAETEAFYCWLKSVFGKATDSERSLCSRLVALFGSVLLALLFPVLILLIFVFYTVHVSPLSKMISIFIHYYQPYVFWLHRKYQSVFKKMMNILLLHHRSQLMVWCFRRVFTSLFFTVVLICCSCCLCFIVIVIILHRSLLLSAKLIAYLWMGFAASKEYYYPRIALFSVLVYYCWNCLSSVKKRYQVLLNQTFEKCKEHQEKHPDGRKALIFDKEGVPRISFKLFEKVIGQILPTSEVYTKMILKIIAIGLFMYLTFSSILVYGKSNLDKSTQTLAVLLTGLLPKIIEIFGEGDSYRQLYDTENACRIEKIVRDFLTNPDDEYRINHDDQQSQSSPSSCGIRGREVGDNSLTQLSDFDTRVP